MGLFRDATKRYDDPVDLMEFLEELYNTPDKIVNRVRNITGKYFDRFYDPKTQDLSLRPSPKKCQYYKGYEKFFSPPNSQVSGLESP